MALAMGLVLYVPDVFLKSMFPGGNLFAVHKLYFPDSVINKLGGLVEETQLEVPHYLSLQIYVCFCPPYYS